MKTRYMVALSMIAGAALGGAAIQGLHAQAKPKAYTVSEIETLDATAQAAYVPHILDAIKAAGGRTYNTAGGKIAAIVGIAWKRRRLFTARRLGKTLPHSVTRPKS